MRWLPRSVNTTNCGMHGSAGASKQNFTRANNLQRDEQRSHGTIYNRDKTAFAKVNAQLPASSIMKDAASQEVIQDFLNTNQPPRSGRAARQRGRV